MTVAEAMRAVEGERLAALTNVASNLKTFLRIAAAQPEVEALARAMANSPAGVSQVFHQAKELSATSATDELEHQGDAALATYLWLLSNHPQEFAQVAAGILREQQHFFWARKVAERSPTANGTANADGKVAKGQTTGETDEATRTAAQQGS